MEGNRKHDRDFPVFPPFPSSPFALPAILLYTAERLVSSNYKGSEILMDLKYLGRRSTEPIDELDTFPAPAGLGVVTMTSDELTALCPVTGQPDFYTITIDYTPGPLCIESKSLKLYLWHFREQGVFCEQLAVDIRDTVVETIQPRSCTVTLVQKARGGITITAVSSYAEEGE